MRRLLVGTIDQLGYQTTALYDARRQMYQHEDELGFLSSTVDPSRPQAGVC